MVENPSFSRKIFLVCNYLFLGLLALTCILPLLNVLAISFSSSHSAAAGLVKFWPVEFTTASYEYALAKKEFLLSFWVSIKRLVLGVGLNMLLTIVIAYPLSKETKEFKFRTVYVWIFVFTMLFNGGLIPTYIVVKETGLLDTIWALILPGAVPIFNVVLLLNFFRSLPKSLEEAAYIDGASHWQTLWKIYVPLSKPALATITLFAAVMHWNEWFSGLIYMNSPDGYPLSSYLQTVVVEKDLSLVSSADLGSLQEISDQTSKAAQVFLGALPILMVYPFLQRYFMSGIVLGSVKE